MLHLGTGISTDKMAAKFEILVWSAVKGEAEGILEGIPERSRIHSVFICRAECTGKYLAKERPQRGVHSGAKKNSFHIYLYIEWNALENIW